MPIRDRIRPVVCDLLGRLVDCGHESYIVGGAVRDLLMGIEPKDYDIATAATPEEVRRAFGRRRCRIIGRRFRLAHVYAGSEIYEVSTFRRTPTADERSERLDDDGIMIWRDNEFGTLEDDATRRDFTANALYYDPVGDRGVIDLVGGVKDIEERVARAIGDPMVRLEEDPVRVLRGLKLVGQFGFSLDPGLEAAIRAKGPRIALASQSRLFEELLKILATGRALPVLAAFQNYGFLTAYWPAMAQEWDTPVGDMTRRVLEERDRRIAAGACSLSKALALATAALPWVTVRLGSPRLGEFWEHTEGVEHHCREAVQEFFAPFPVSRLFTARIRDILLLLPRLAGHLRVGRLVRHPEYKYARELYALVGAVMDWPPERLSQWPPPEGEPAPRRHPAGRRRRPRRRASDTARNDTT
ncbi:MAG: hypothetical protein JXR77_13625 [Lentisphaeria bacterium]|nr:hypothetical protein [Lentisphaeria bacterium]